MKWYLLLFLLVYVQLTNAQKIHFTDMTDFWYCTGVDSGGNLSTAYYLYNGSQIFGIQNKKLVSSTIDRSS